MTEPSSSNISTSSTSNRKGGSEGASSGGTAPPPPLHATQLDHVAEGGPQEEAAGEQEEEDAAQEAQEEGQEVQEEEELFPELQLELPTATHVKVKQAAYISSCVKQQDCPPPKYPEFAVIGRSNVGKSSLINMITNSKKLAHVSKEPGEGCQGGSITYVSIRHLRGGQREDALACGGCGRGRGEGWWMLIDGGHAEHDDHTAAVASIALEHVRKTTHSLSPSLSPCAQARPAASITF
jgi:hypothetical protein